MTLTRDKSFSTKDFSSLVGDLIHELETSRGGRSPLTDVTEGSVVRTLVEAFARELAVCYQQLQIAYRSGYLDTATGIALDHVVALFGIERHGVGHVEGMVTFSRTTPAPHQVVIPAGTLVAGRGVPPFETVGEAILPLGATEVTTAVRALAAGGATVEPGAITAMQRTVDGVEWITNPAALVPRRAAETDDELRARARVAVHGGRTATTSAITRAATALGVSEIHVQERPDRPGVVEVIIGDADIPDDNPKADVDLVRIQRAVDDVRPAGVRISVRPARVVHVELAARIELDRERAAFEIAELKQLLDRRVRDYVQRLGVNDNVRWAKIRNLLASHDAVTEVHIDDLVNGGPLRVTDESDPVAGRVLPNHDVFIGGDERAELVEEVRLSFEPPILRAWLDVTASLKADTNMVAAEAGETIRINLESFLPDEPLAAGAKYTHAELEGAIATAVTDELAQLEILVLHDRDGRVTSLIDANDADRFTTSEQIVVRNIAVRNRGDEA